MTRDIKENEQSKEAGVVRLRTPLPTICIDWSTGLICALEPVEDGGHVIPFSAKRNARVQSDLRNSLCVETRITDVISSLSTQDKS